MKRATQQTDDSSTEAGNIIITYCLKIFKQIKSEFDLSSPFRGTGGVLFILKISPFPCLDEIGPGSRIEDIHGRSLSVIKSFVSYFLELKWLWLHRHLPEWFASISFVWQHRYFFGLSQYHHQELWY